MLRHMVHGGRLRRWYSGSQLNGESVLARSVYLRGMRFSLVLAVLAAAVGTSSQAGAQGAAAIAWEPVSMRLETPTTPPSSVRVGGREVRAALGIATPGTPHVSASGAWVVWVGERGITLRHMASGAIRAVPMPVGARAEQAAFFGPDEGMLGIAMFETRADGSQRPLLAVYDLATLSLVQVLAATDLGSACGELVGTASALVCMTTRARDGRPPSAVMLDASGAPLRAVDLAGYHDVSHAVAVAAVVHFVGGSDRGSDIVSLDVATGTLRAFAAPSIASDESIAALAVSPSGSHVAIGTSSRAVSVHALPSGRVVRRIAPHDGHRDRLALTDDLDVWEERDGRLAVIPSEGAVRQYLVPIHFAAIRVTLDAVVLASHGGLCVLDRTTGTLDPARSAVSDGAYLQGARWSGDEIATWSTASTERGVVVPVVTRWNVVSGAVTAVDYTFDALFAARGEVGVVPPRFTGDVAAGTPFASAIAGDRMIVARAGTEWLYDPVADRELAELGFDPQFFASGAQVLDASHRELVVRSSRDGHVERSVTPLRDYYRPRISPDARYAVLRAERRVELVTMESGAMTTLHSGVILDAAIRPDGREVAVSDLCADGEGCIARLRRFAIPSGELVATQSLDERASLLVYAPTSDAIGLVSESGIVIASLATRSSRAAR